MKHFDDPVLSRMQSALEEGLLKHNDFDPEHSLEDQLGQHKHMQALNQALSSIAKQGRKQVKAGSKIAHKRASAIQKQLTCVDIYIHLVLLHVSGKKDAYRRLKEEVKFSQCDAEWVEAITHYLEAYHPGIANHIIRYVRHKAMTDFIIDDLKPDLRVGILGDWGTGTPIAIEVLKKLVAKKPDVIIHLGDVYYSGSKAEFERKFVQPLKQYARREDGTEIPVLNMAGNHDMYSGAGPYFDMIRELNPGTEFRQPASYFGLRLKNRKWQILCADTGRYDHDPFQVTTGLTHLESSEIAWHRHQVKHLADEGGKTIFVSHHQPFSAFDQLGSLARKGPSDFFSNPRLLADYRKIASQGEVPLWLWGHEHNLSIYKPYAGVKRGRCIGHSAVPVIVGEDDPNAPHRLQQHDLWKAFIGLIKGKWGVHIGRQARYLYNLKRDYESVPKPELDDSTGAPVYLDEYSYCAQTGDEDHNIDMYCHGYTLLSFGAGATGDGVTVDYYDDLHDKPLFTETID
jgi:3',5'-cyclic AMP phosphodiesterase CpdA